LQYSLILFLVSRFVMTWLMGFFRSAVLLATDVCVPISRLAEIIEKSQKYLQEDGIYGPLMGHVGGW